MDLENAADNGASLDELLDIVRSMDDPNDLYNVMDLCAGDSYEDNLLWNTAKTKRDTILSMTDRKGSCGHCERPDNLNTIAQSVVLGMSRKIGEPSRKGAQAFATGNSGAIMKDISNVLKNQTVSNKLQKTFGTEAQKQQAIANENKIKENNEQVALNNKLSSMSSKERQDYENVQAVNQRAKDKLAKDTQDDMYEEVMGDYDRLRAQNQKAKQQREQSLHGSRNGSRKGSAIWNLKGSERQELYNRIDSKLKSEGHPWDYVYTVTGKDYEDSAYSTFAEMPENKEWINGLILEITRDRNNY